MACRCSDIRTAERDMRRMEDALDDINDIIREFERAAMVYAQVLVWEREAYHLRETDFDRIDQVIGTENAEIVEELHVYRNRIYMECDNLSRKINRMADEDDRYHSEDEE